ncbi:CAP domain-containing protein [Streptomyces sp. ms191]|uniref:CAP domain-containing protein n=1 Tax=Streptomyces sp. ms191 TaxID=1827978 RepID=UPI0011CEBF36|nr:CAP domain-containing protein [Streptomyces sp. ms191]TXS22576.1 CAP domain-containing protein [Streptomyces sp. ms191]
MGRHRRSGAAPAAEGYADGSDSRHPGTGRRRPVRTGLLGASAAVAVGAAVAVAAGLLPGGSSDTVGSVSAEARKTESRQAPELLTQQGGASATPSIESKRPTTGTGTGKTASPSAKPKPKPAPSKTTAAPAPKKTAAPKPKPKPAAPKTTAAPAPEKPVAKPSRTATPKPAPTAHKPVERPKAPAPTAAPAGRDTAAATEVVRLVNQQRALVGCTPVTADSGLSALADAFSRDMAARGFFDHTDPDGATPWVRAQKAGIANMGGENIARGQVDAAAVMQSWMASDGHRANILNCDFKTIGVGVHFADGGPWWTQDFGY